MAEKNKITFASLSPYVDYLEENKESILIRWMSNQEVRSVLNSHKIPIVFFANHFGIKMIDYTLGIVRGNNKSDICPVISIVLKFFKSKHLHLEDIFTICVNLKNTLNSCLMEINALNLEVLNEISVLMDRKFKGVIREYVQLTTENNKARESTDALSKDESIFACSIHSSQGEPLCTSAYQFLQEIDIDIEILDELEDIEKETLYSLRFSGVVSQEAQDEVMVLFGDYLRVLNMLIEFKELAHALQVLIELLQTISVDSLVEEKGALIGVYYKAIIEDLSLWRKAVFVNQNAEDIHYLDKTLLSSIAQLEILLEESDEIMTQDIEFF